MIKTRHADHLHATKYRGPNETHREAMNRVAAALTTRFGDDGYHEFRDTLHSLRFMPAGRIQSAIGSGRQVTAANCYVAGTIEDSYVAGHGSIMQRAKEAAATMRMGGGVGYDFSTLRPRGAAIQKLQSTSSGPVSFMEIFDAVCRATCSSGHRRGAQMGVLRVDHPDIEEFVRAKHQLCQECDYQHLSGFNVSAGLTDEFMQAVVKDRVFSLRHGGMEYRTISARALFDLITRSTWDFAEPGVLFLDTINRMNNLHYCETIAATNPCSEQPLPPHGACILGSFNLTKYVTGSVGQWSLDLQQLRDDIPYVVRAMDRVICASLWPLYEQEKEARDKRRMGLGVTGLANTLEALGHNYGSDGFLAQERKVLTLIRDNVYRASARLARERGSFPLYDRDAFLASGFMSTMPDEVVDEISVHGIRNSHLLSIAPTGTISLCADNVSSGIEPVVAHEVKRLINYPDGQRQVSLRDYGTEVFGVEGKTIADVSVKEHIEVLSVAAELVDSSVSKTINVPSGSPWDEFQNVYMECWKRGIKGCATYRHGGRRDGILTVEDSSACALDEFGRKDCS